MYQEAPRWLLIVVLIACLVGLVAWARGPEHHHGQYVGAFGAVHATAHAAQA